ncbi:MAG: NADH-quinone oxidoreductase subunit L [Acidobacteria bacterium]|nr:NADH-quinone oxidoreductase subunit L [Acidobacteriota bacterium]
MLPYLVLIPLAPLAGFLVVGLLSAMGLVAGRTAHRIAVAAAALSFLFSVAAVLDFANGIDEYAPLAAAHPGSYEVAGGGHDAKRFEVTVAQWLPLGDVTLKGWGADGARGAHLSIDWRFAIDSLACIMLLVVSGIGTLIHVYSIGYMAGERGYERFFCYMNLFLAMMLTLVLGANVLVMFVGWEGVGLCSYLLIGFYYDRMFDKETGMSCADCGRKAFVTNRIGDFGFLLGGLLLLVTFGTFDFSDIAHAINTSSSYWYGAGLLTGIGVLLFVGATGKSAQVPLYVWLPDAMAGPTPVSALIHAATMVTAGVYMLARTSAIYWHAPDAMLVVAIVGCVTAVFAGTMGLGQYDIKKILAYSTVSQLGYMFLGAGVGAFSASIFHLTTHAFFKACLFLGAGSVIARAGHSNDIRLYGGLRRFMPLTFLTFLVSTLALAGFPLLSGFMSKDEILAQSLFATRGHWLLWAFGTFGAVLTSLYMFRCVALTFYGENRSPEHVRSHLGESPRVMTWVLATLAAGAVVAGFFGVPAGVTNLVGAPGLNWFEGMLHPVVAAQGVVAAAHGHEAAEAHAGAGEVLREGLKRHPSTGEDWGLFLLAGIVFAAGLLGAWWAFRGDMSRAARVKEAFRPVFRLLHRKWYVDELYDRLVLQPFYALCRAFHAIDQFLVDGAVNGTARLTLALSHAQALHDRFVVDLAVNGVGWGVRLGGWALRRVQTGYVQSYAALLVVAGFILFATYLLVR